MFNRHLKRMYMPCALNKKTIIIILVNDFEKTYIYPDKNRSIIYAYTLI